MAKDETQRLREAAVDLLEIVFEGQIVGQVELADARRIAAAAEILEQQGVVELRQIGFRRGRFAADMHSDPAAANAVAGRLALGHVQRMAERAQQLGQPNLTDVVFLHAARQARPV